MSLITQMNLLQNTSLIGCTAFDITFSLFFDLNNPIPFATLLCMVIWLVYIYILYTTDFHCFSLLSAALSQHHILTF